MKMTVAGPRGRVIPWAGGAPRRTRLNHGGNKTSGYLVVKSLLTVALVVTGGCGSSSNRQQAQQPTPAPSATPKSVDPQDLLRYAREKEFTTLPAKVQLTKEPYIKGKVAPYFQSVSLEKKAKNEKALWVFNTNAVYERKYSLAGSPEDVGTVILQRCEEISMGNYLKGFTEEKIPAYGWKCEITIVDRTIPAVIYRKTFQTELGKAEITGKDDNKISGPPPFIAMNEFLAALPHK
jgi:hypothetical protein